jgi:hypothetical protein
MRYLELVTFSLETTNNVANNVSLNAVRLDHATWKQTRHYDSSQLQRGSSVSNSKIKNKSVPEQVPAEATYMYVRSALFMVMARMLPILIDGCT